MEGRMGNHRHNLLKITIINLWYNHQYLLSTTIAVATALFASG